MLQYFFLKGRDLTTVWLTHNKTTLVLRVKYALGKNTFLSLVPN